MKSIRAHQTGGPEVLMYEDAEDPAPGPGQALVDIKAIGVNYTDVASRIGANPPASFPWTPGREAAGVVTALGDGVSEVAVATNRFLGNDLYSVSGGWFDRHGLSPATTAISGCRWGGRDIETDIVAAPGLFLQFGNRVTTTRIQQVSVVRCGGQQACN